MVQKLAQRLPGRARQRHSARAPLAEKSMAPCPVNRTLPYSDHPTGMSSLRNLLHSTYKSAAERVLPARSQSAFKEKGVSA